MSFTVSYIKKVSKRQDTDLCRFSTFIPEISCCETENFDIEMTEASGITGNK